MPPTQVPIALSLLADALRSAAGSADRAASTLLERRWHHVPCNGDGSVVDVLMDDWHQLDVRRHRLLALATAVDEVRTQVVRRLAVLAADEAAVRARLASPALTAVQAARVHGSGPWVTTVAGPVQVPETGDPAWAALVGVL